MLESVLVVDDDPGVLDSMAKMLELDYTVHTADSGHSGLNRLASHPDIAVAIVDQRMPEMSGTEFITVAAQEYPSVVPIILTGYTDRESVVQAINSARIFGYLDKPVNRQVLTGTLQRAFDQYHGHRESLRHEEQLRLEIEQLKQAVKGKYGFDGIIGCSAALDHALKLVRKILYTTTPVLITGESGTGKELIARTIHVNGPRQDKPLIAVNCAAIVETLLESELFGHKKGSFNEAKEDRKGHFETANGGTLFLDEIGDLPLGSQAKLLRVLQQGEITRVGESVARAVDVRIIAATNRDLADMVRTQCFREDLYYRLNVFPIRVPPLRERRDDIPLLVRNFIQRLQQSSAQFANISGISPAAMDCLYAFDYPGNIRELANEVERACLLASGDGPRSITPDVLSDRFQIADCGRAFTQSAAAAEGLPTTNGGSSLVERLSHFEREVLVEELNRNGGSRKQTANSLGIALRTLFEKLKRYEIE